MPSDCSAVIGQFYSAAALPLVRMPAKGKYLLNEQKLKQEALYRKFSGISQYQPFVLLLGLSMLTCATLLVLFFSLKLVRHHNHFLTFSHLQMLKLTQSKHDCKITSKNKLIQCRTNFEI